MNPEKRSTYLYEALYSQYSVFEGFSVQWVDGNEDEKKVIRSVKSRLNVAEFQFDKNHKLEKVPALLANGVTLYPSYCFVILNSATLL